MEKSLLHLRELNGPIRLGILGCGSFIQRRILPALVAVPAIKLVALQKRDLGLCHDLASQYHCKAYSTRSELLKDPDVELVFVATQNSLHEEDVIASFQAKKSVFCEKPLAPTSVAIQRMLDAAKKAELPFFVGHSLRFKTAVKKAKEILDEGRLGTLLKGHFRMAIPVASENWRRQKECGVLHDLGVHIVDLVHFITSQEIEHVKAFSQEPQSVTGLFKLSNAAVILFECSFDEPFYTGFELIGTKGRLRSEHSLRQSDLENESLIFFSTENTEENIPLERENIYVQELRHVAAILRDRTLECLIPATIALKNQLIIEKIEESLLSNRF